MMRRRRQRQGGIERLGDSFSRHGRPFKEINVAMSVPIDKAVLFLRVVNLRQGKGSADLVPGLGRITAYRHQKYCRAGCK